MPETTVRQAGASDLAALARLFDAYRQFYGRAGNLPAAREFLAARLDRSESVLFLAEEADTPAGFAQLYPSFSSVSLARSFVLNDLFVAPAFRRRGVASRLLSAAAGYAESVGAVRLTLSTATDNRAAQALYESMGWRRDELFHVYHLALRN